ncbi:hypothetical protein D3C71_2144780 [compost metagenome]
MAAREGRVASTTLARAMAKAISCSVVSDSPSATTPTTAALTGSMTLNTPPWAAGTALRPVIQSHTVHMQAASA